MIVKTVLATAAVVMMLGAAGTANAAAKCSQKMLVGTWAYTDYEGGEGPEDVAICLLELNTKGQVMTSSCFSADDTAPRKGTQNVSGKLTVSKACNVEGVIRQGKQTRRLKGTLDPVKGVLDVKANGRLPITYNQQW